MLFLYNHQLVHFQLHQYTIHFLIFYYFQSNDYFQSNEKNDLKKEIIVIKGNVSLKKDGNIMVGEKLLIDFQSGISQIEGAKNKGKVKMKYNSPSRD